MTLPTLYAVQRIADGLYLDTQNRFGDGPRLKMFSTEHAARTYRVGYSEYADRPYRLFRQQYSTLRPFTDGFDSHWRAFWNVWREEHPYREWWEARYRVVPVRLQLDLPLGEVKPLEDEDE